MKIKYKFLLYLTPIFTVALIVVSVLSIRIFQKDKIAYVFATTLENTQTASSLIQSELKSQEPLLELLLSSFDFANKKFPVEARKFLQLNETLAWVQVEDTQGHRFDSLGADPGQREVARKRGKKNSENAMPTWPVFFPDRKDLWGLVHNFQMKGYPPENFRIYLVYKRNPVKALLDRPKYFDLFLVRADGALLSQPEELADPKTLDVVRDRAQEIIQDGSTAVTREIVTDDGEEYLVAWAPAEGTDLGFVSVTSKAKAIQAIEKMKKTSFGVLLILLSLGFFLIFAMITALTDNIEILTKCLQAFAGGNMAVRSGIDTTDEIGTMSRVFNQMVEKIIALVKQTVEKARMEGELETARNVQQRFIPPPDFETEYLKISGHYEPASECGGDWWFYLNEGRYCTVLIGDVTGHGVASALITSALRAGVSALQNIAGLTLEDYVMNLNKVIYDSGQGNIMVTFFVARIDLETGDMAYVNASHCPPVVIPHNYAETEECLFLDEIGGKRLGDDPSARYTAGHMKLSPKDILFGFTDGLHEFENSEGKMFGERRMMKNLKKSADKDAGIADYRALMLKEFKDFQKKDLLSDDLTLFFFQLKKQQQAKPAAGVQAEAG